MHKVFLQGWQFQRNRQIPEALQCYETAKEAGDKCALFHRNCMDRYGQDMPMNVNNTTRWSKFTLTDEEFELLYQCYKDIDEVESQFNLAILYDIRKVSDQALKYLMLVEAQSYLPVFNYLGWYYSKIKDHKTAIKWYMQGSDHQCPRSQYCLGNHYYKGLECEQNYETAIKWWKLSTIHNYRKSHYKLAQIYRIGIHVNRDIQQAVNYYKLASDKGCPKAELFLNEILSYEAKIPKSLKEFIPIGKAYGISYLFFGNFLAYLTQKYRINVWDDLFFRPWITKALVTYFHTTNPNFSEQLIAEWFQNLFAEEI